MRLLATIARVFAFLCYHLQIPVRHGRAGVGPGIASHNDLGAAGGQHNPSDPSFMQGFIGLIDDEHRNGHLPEVWVPHKPQKAFLLSPDEGSTSSLVTSTAPPLPEVHTISGLQQALKMLGIALPSMATTARETRQVVTSFQSAPESSPIELPAHRRKQSYSANGRTLTALSLLRRTRSRQCRRWKPSRGLLVDLCEKP
jgi:hypothetical protein